MGLFSGKKNPDKEPPREGRKDEAPKPPSSPPANPLAPPSAQQRPGGGARLPSTPPSGPRKQGKGGPTPPGGLLPTPDWHSDFHEEDRRPPSAEARRPPSSQQSEPGPTRITPQPPSAGHPPARQGGPVPTKISESETLVVPQKGRPTPPSATPSEKQHRPTDPVFEVSPGTGEGASDTSRPLGSLARLLREAVERGASDLHLTRGVPPMIRLDGYLMPLDYPALTREQCERLVLSPLNTVQKAKFDEGWELDYSLDLPDAGRFRVNIHRQRGGIEAAYRVVNEVILPLRKLGLPGVVEEVARKHMGLVLVTGPTGSGKTTTMAAIVDQINAERQCMIITVEDPIEYVHRNKRSIVKQREVWSDTRSFANALRHVLRQDPDVIIIGEMRDLETISTALMAAETGHLVFATLHTPDATQTVDRMIDVFPPHQQEQARIQVANTLQAVVAQQLIPVPGNRGRVVAVEILIATVGVKKIVRSGKTEQLYTTMQTNWEQGMITMDKSLKMLYQQGLISFDDAIARCRFPTEFDQL